MGLDGSDTGSDHGEPTAEPSREANTPEIEFLRALYLSRASDISPETDSDHADIDDDLPGRYQDETAIRDTFAQHAVGEPPKDAALVAPDYISETVIPADAPVHGEPSDGTVEVAENRELAGYVVDLAKSGLQSMLWRVAEVASLHLSPIGPPIVRGVYLGKQLYTALKGLRDGDGFFLKVAIPGLDLESGGVLPEGLEVVAQVRIGDGGTSLRINGEIQIFKQWAEWADVQQVELPSRPGGVPPGRTPSPGSADPWNILLPLIGDELIHDLGDTLALVAQLPAAELERNCVNGGTRLARRVASETLRADEQPLSATVVHNGAGGGGDRVGGRMAV